MNKPVRLNSLATAVPEHVFTQHKVSEILKEAYAPVFPNFDQALPVIFNAEIDTRHSGIPDDWLREDYSFEKRNDIAVESSIDLGEEVTRLCLERAGMESDEIGGIILVTSTALAMPSIDAMIVERMGLRRNILRLPIFGLGCVGGTVGLARAAMMARAEPGMRVLLLVIEHNVGTFWKGDLTKQRFIAGVLFGDGAAGAIVSCEGEGPVIAGWGEHTWPDSLDFSAWKFRDGGFRVLFSRKIPVYAGERLSAAVNEYLESQNLSHDDIDAYVLHPGGRRVIDAIGAAMKRIPEEDINRSKGIMREYGNMSAPTVLFVLERTLAQKSGRFLLAALGPGFTAGFVTLEV